MTLFADNDQYIFLDSGHGNHRNFFAFTGNDYVSAFFKKGKRKPVGGCCRSIQSSLIPSLSLEVTGKHIVSHLKDYIMCKLFRKQRVTCRHSKAANLLG